MRKYVVKHYMNDGYVTNAVFDTRDAAETFIRNNFWNHFGAEYTLLRHSVDTVCNHFIKEEEYPDDIPKTKPEVFIPHRDRDD